MDSHTKNSSGRPQRLSIVPPIKLESSSEIPETNKSATKFGKFETPATTVKDEGGSSDTMSNIPEYAVTSIPSQQEDIACKDKKRKEYYCINCGSDKHNLDNCNGPVDCDGCIFPWHRAYRSRTKER
jgi:hypothetical protein